MTEIWYKWCTQHESTIYDDDYNWPGTTRLSWTWRVCGCHRERDCRCERWNGKKKSKMERKNINILRTIKHITDTHASLWWILIIKILLWSWRLITELDSVKSRFQKWQNREHELGMGKSVADPGGGATGMCPPPPKGKKDWL